MDRILGAYEGLAEVVMENGSRYPCHADLKRGEEMVADEVGGPPIPGFPWWRGTIELDDDHSAGLVEAIEYAALEANGREANFRVTGRVGGRLSIHSNGSGNRAPFD